MKNINWKLCLVADTEACGEKNVIAVIQDASDSGVTLVQLRGKNLSTREFLETGLKAARILKKKNIPFIINDRVDIALCCEADGVHLGQNDLPLVSARKIMGKDKLIGISVNTVNEALEAEREKADYLGVGTVFHTQSKKDISPIIGLEGLKDIRKRVKLPLLAIGGINPENAAQVIAAGADGIAVISAIAGENDTKKATRDLIEAIGGAGRSKLNRNNFSGYS